MPIQPATKRLFRNIASVTALQSGAYILAIINVPYLTRTLGVAHYGVMAFSISVNAYLWLVMDWGFSLGASREIARANGDLVQIREVFWRTMTAKAILSLVALTVLAAVATIDKVPGAFYIVFLPGALNILSAILSVDWLVQGLQRMGLFSLYSIAGRALVVLLTFLLVHGPDDTWRACLLQTFGSLVASAAGFLIVRRFFKMGDPIIHVHEAIRQIWDYRHYFLTQSSWIAYSTAAPLLLTIVSGSVAVGLFTGAERIVRIAMSLISPVTTSMYPHVNTLITESKEAAADAAGLLLAAQLVFGLVLSFIILIGAKTAVALLLGSRFAASADVLRCLAVLPLLTGIGGTLSAQFLIPLGWRREVSHVTVSGTAVYLVALTYLGYHNGALGAAIALVLTEAFIAAGLVALLLRYEREFTRMSCRAVIHAPDRLLQASRTYRAKIKRNSSQVA